MDEHISVASNWRREVSIFSHSQAKMADFCHIDRTHAEVNGLVHAPCRQNSHYLIEERIVLPNGYV